jgi:hypothetical protein
VTGYPGVDLRERRLQVFDAPSSLNKSRRPMARCHNLMRHFGHRHVHRAQPISIRRRTMRLSLSDCDIGR